MISSRARRALARQNSPLRALTYIVLITSTAHAGHAPLVPESRTVLIRDGVRKEVADSSACTADPDGVVGAAGASAHDLAPSHGEHGASDDDDSIDRAAPTAARGCGVSPEAPSGVASWLALAALGALLKRRSPR
jgi:MYXO-CTERM domain-containing protein